MPQLVRYDSRTPAPTAHDPRAIVLSYLSSGLVSAVLASDLLRWHQSRHQDLDFHGPSNDKVACECRKCRQERCFAWWQDGYCVPHYWASGDRKRAGRGRAYYSILYGTVPFVQLDLGLSGTHLPTVRECWVRNRIMGPPSCYGYKTFADRKRGLLSRRSGLEFSRLIMVYRSSKAAQNTTCRVAMLVSQHGPGGADAARLGGHCR